MKGFVWKNVKPFSKKLKTIQTVIMSIKHKIQKWKAYITMIVSQFDSSDEDDEASDDEELQCDDCGMPFREKDKGCSLVHLCMSTF